MSQLRRRKILSKLLFAILGLAVFLFSYQLGNRYAQLKKDDIHAYLPPESIPLEPLSLIDEEGAAFEQGEFKGYWTFVMPGDHKLESCTLLMRKYVLAWNRLAHNKSLQNMTRVAFLSLADTDYPLNELKYFIEFMHPDFIALTGERNNVLDFASQLGYAEPEKNSARCNESGGTVALINPEGALIALFTGIVDPAIIAHDLETITTQ